MLHNAIEKIRTVELHNPVMWFSAKSELAQLFYLVLKVFLILSVSQKMGEVPFKYCYEQTPQAWVWAHHISTLVRLLPDHRVVYMKNSVPLYEVVSTQFM